MTNHAISIIGGGPAGMTLAWALAKNGITATIHDARTRADAAGDPRILALSQGSMLILEELDIWADLSPTPIETIHVSHAGGFGRTRISALEEGTPALGYVVKAGDISASLIKRLAKSKVDYRECNKIDAHNLPPAQLTVWAEGAADEAASFRRNYDQSAVICTAKPAVAYANQAWERFTAHGPVAALPYGEEYALVYTTGNQEATALAAVSDTEFLAALTEVFSGRISFTAVSARHVYPLGLRYRASIINDRAVWIGNAAQTLHPVGGQGFNLALRDIHELAHTLVQAHVGGSDLGAPATLSRYERARRRDRRATIEITHGLARLFSTDYALPRIVRSLGLLALDTLPPLRSLFARQMMYGWR